MASPMASPLLVQKSSSSCRGLGDPIGFQGLFHPAGTQNSINDQVIESGAKKQCKKPFSVGTHEAPVIFVEAKKRNQSDCRVFLKVELQSFVEANKIPMSMESP